MPGLIFRLPENFPEFMNDYNSDIDIAMHICHHHQFYWEKKNDNDIDNVTWQRTEYTHYVTEQISDIPTTTNFLNRFRQATAAPARPVRDTDTPNDRPRGPPKTADEDIRKRFEKRLQKEKTHDVSSTSESELPPKPIKAKAMPRQQKGTARMVSSAAASDSQASASRSAESSVRNDRRKPVKGSAAKRETSTQAKELRMPRLPRNFSPSLSKKQMSWNGINVLLDLNAVKNLIPVCRRCHVLVPPMWLCILP